MAARSTLAQRRLRPALPTNRQSKAKEPSCVRRRSRVPQGRPGTMGMLMAKLWSSFFGLEEFKILIVGLNNAGKTTTLYKLCAQLS